MSAFRPQYIDGDVEGLLPRLLLQMGCGGVDIYGLSS